MAEQNNVPMNTENEDVLLRSNDETEISVREHQDHQTNRHHHRMSRRERDERHSRNAHSAQRQDDSHRHRRHTSSRSHETSHYRASSTHTRRPSRSTRQATEPAKRKSKHNYNSSSCIQSPLILLPFCSRTLLQMWEVGPHKEELHKPNKEKTTETPCPIHL